MTRLRLVTEQEVRANARPLTSALLAVAPRQAIRAVPCSRPGCNCPPGDHDRTCDQHRREHDHQRGAA